MEAVQQMRSRWCIKPTFFRLDDSLRRAHHRRSFYLDLTPIGRFRVVGYSQPAPGR